MSLFGLKDREPPRPEGFIDVRELIARFDIAEHARLADGYFKDFTLDRTEFRKPFHPQEAPQLFAHLGVGLGLLEVFPGARIVDFGCGTGWLSQGLAQMGAHAIAVDVSKKALELGRTYTLGKFPELASRIDYLAFDGQTIDLPDGSVDRTICFDSFHHVANQARVIAEFHRILAEDGFAVFCEPGPRHSKAQESQQAMRLHDVIENDILVEEIWEHARQAGFTDIRLSMFQPKPVMISLDELNSLRSFWTSWRMLRRSYDYMLRPLYDNTRMFVLTKGRPQPDSRKREGLAGEITAEVEDLGAAWRIFGTVVNCGTAVWRKSGGEAGAVNLGLSLKTPDGSWVADFRRVFFLSEPLSPSARASFEILVDKAEVGDAEIWADLVSEQVAWFSQLTSKQVKVR
jgi:SAM-dependent methyltransferase